MDDVNNNPAAASAYANMLQSIKDNDVDKAKKYFAEFLDIASDNTIDNQYKDKENVSHAIGTTSKAEGNIDGHNYDPDALIVNGGPSKAAVSVQDLFNLLAPTMTTGILGKEADKYAESNATPGVGTQPAWLNDIISGAYSGANGANNGLIPQLIDQITADDTFAGYTVGADTAVGYADAGSLLYAAMQFLPGQLGQTADAAAADGVVSKLPSVNSKDKNVNPSFHWNSKDNNTVPAQYLDTSSWQEKPDAEGNVTLPDQFTALVNSLPDSNGTALNDGQQKNAWDYACSKSTNPPTLSAMLIALAREKHLTKNDGPTDGAGNQINDLERSYGGGLTKSQLKSTLQALYPNLGDQAETLASAGVDNFKPEKSGDGCIDAPEIEALFGYINQNIDATTGQLKSGTDTKTEIQKALPKDSGQATTPTPETSGTVPTVAANPNDLAATLLNVDYTPASGALQGGVSAAVDATKFAVLAKNIGIEDGATINAAEAALAALKNSANITTTPSSAQMLIALLQAKLATGEAAARVKTVVDNMKSTEDSTRGGTLNTQQVKMALDGLFPNLKTEQSLAFADFITKSDNGSCTANAAKIDQLLSYIRKHYYSSGLDSTALNPDRTVITAGILPTS